MKHISTPHLTASVVRWTARALGTFIAGILLMFMIGEHYNPFTMQLRDAIHTLLMPVGVVVGLALAWRWEQLGGALATGGMTGWYLFETVKSGRLTTGWYFALILLPGLLFLWSAQLRRRANVLATP
jgi:hypothetical protein